MSARPPIFGPLLCAQIIIASSNQLIQSVIASQELHTKLCPRRKRGISLLGYERRMLFPHLVNIKLKMTHESHTLNETPQERELCTPNTMQTHNKMANQPAINSQKFQLLDD